MKPATIIIRVKGLWMITALLLIIAAGVAFACYEEYEASLLPTITLDRDL